MRAGDDGDPAEVDCSVPSCSNVQSISATIITPTATRPAPTRAPSQRPPGRTAARTSRTPATTSPMPSHGVCPKPSTSSTGWFKRPVDAGLHEGDDAERRQGGADDQRRGPGRRRTCARARPRAPRRRRRTMSRSSRSRSRTVVVVERPQLVVDAGPLVLADAILDVPGEHGVLRAAAAEGPGGPHRDGWSWFSSWSARSSPGFPGARDGSTVPVRVTAPATPDSHLQGPHCRPWVTRC